MLCACCPPPCQPCPTMRANHWVAPAASSPNHNLCLLSQRPQGAASAGPSSTTPCTTSSPSHTLCPVLTQPPPLPPPLPTMGAASAGSSSPNHTLCPLLTLYTLLGLQPQGPQALDPERAREGRSLAGPGRGAGGEGPQEVFVPGGHAQNDWRLCCAGGWGGVMAGWVQCRATPMPSALAPPTWSACCSARP